MYIAGTVGTVLIREVSLFQGVFYRDFPSCISLCILCMIQDSIAFYYNYVIIVLHCNQLNCCSFTDSHTCDLYKLCNENEGLVCTVGARTQLLTNFWLK